MDFDKIISDLKNKVYHPVYFLMGEEPYFIDAVSDFIENNVLKTEEKEFNQIVLYGSETTVQQAISEAKSFPMLSNYRVVIVKEAQNIKGLTPVPSSKQDMKENKKHPFETYLENPQKSTILVFCYKYKTIDMRTSFAKNLSMRAVVLKSEMLYENKIPSWIEKHVKGKNYSIDPVASRLLTEFLGNNLSKIANEIEKLTINLSPETQITTDHIQKFIGISKEYNNFELQDSLGRKDALKANRIIQYFASNPKDNPLVVTIAILAGYFSKVMMYHFLADKSERNAAAEMKVHPFFVKDYALAARNYSPQKIKNIISILREYDMKSKGYESPAVEEGELLKEMVFKIIH